ncbi:MULTISPECIES: FAD-binding protein [unclassified Pseudofrankia]|uniref:FAD-binding protein n=1 Tax=unclassified Pseudofrankia TaxID=2994372 RepID=UPI0008DB1F41|nr:MULTISPECIES: FAD-binding protein [unclassified Pseudofrankia]MDT3444389.1 FAD-binding protein [Pseudofrankia sp. BMG5.37]OHV56480.1 hypothetical protein BCD48_08425 [Pseudofrankia sp. BMG5.36]
MPGGVFGVDGAGFYGHLVPYGVDLVDPSQFVSLSQFYSQEGLLFNLRGERFVDESVSDAVSTMAVLEQPEARALLVIDQRVRDWWRDTPLVPGGALGPERFELASRRGARCAVANDVDEFADLPEEWGYDAPTIRDALRAASTAEPPGPRRRYDDRPLADPPYYVVDVCPAITFTFGGLVTDADARVLDSRGMPVPGLLAAGADAGGTFVRDYAGGLANALVFGLAAAAATARETRTATA